MKKITSLILAMIMFGSFSVYVNADIDEHEIQQHSYYQYYSDLYDRVKIIFPEAEIASKVAEIDFSVTSYPSFDDLSDNSEETIPVKNYTKIVGDSVYNLDLYEDGTFAVYGAERIGQDAGLYRATDTSGYTVSSGVYRIYYYGFYSYGLQQMGYNTTRAGSSGSYYFTTPYALGMYLINQKSFTYSSSSITFTGNLQEMYFIGDTSYVRDIMGVVVTATVNTSTGAISVSHYYTSVF